MKLRNARVKKRLCKTRFLNKIRKIPSHIKNMPKTIREYPIAGGASIGVMGYLSAYAVKMYQVAKYVASYPATTFWKGYDFQLLAFPFPKMGEYVNPKEMDVLPIVPNLNSLDHAVYSIFCEHPIVGIPLLAGIIAGMGYGTFRLGKWATRKYRGEV